MQLRREDIGGNMIDKNTAIEVTQELTRRCYPYGDTSVDEQRYESLLVKIAVASSLIDEIYEAGELYARHEYSIQHISNRANLYLTELRDTLCEIEYLPPKLSLETSTNKVDTPTNAPTMNRQEAIKYLEQHRHSNPCGRKVLEESNEAIDMAIKALQGDMYCPSCGVRLVSENEYVEPKPYKGE